MGKDSFHHINELTEPKWLSHMPPVSYGPSVSASIHSIILILYTCVPVPLHCQTTVPACVPARRVKAACRDGHVGPLRPATSTGHPSYSSAGRDQQVSGNDAKM